MGAAPPRPSVPRALSWRLIRPQGVMRLLVPEACLCRDPARPHAPGRPCQRRSRGSDKLPAAVGLRSGGRDPGRPAQGRARSSRPFPPLPSTRTAAEPPNLPNPSPSWLGEAPGAEGGEGREGQGTHRRRGRWAVRAGAWGQERAEPQPGPKVSSFCLDAGGSRPPRPASRPPPAPQHPGGAPGSPRPARPTRAPLRGGGGAGRRLRGRPPPGTGSLPPRSALHPSGQRGSPARELVREAPQTGPRNETLKSTLQPKTPKRLPHTEGGPAETSAEEDVPE